MTTLPTIFAVFRDDESLTRVPTFSNDPHTLLEIEAEVLITKDDVIEEVIVTVHTPAANAYDLITVICPSRHRVPRPFEVLQGACGYGFDHTDKHQLLNNLKHWRGTPELFDLFLLKLQQLFPINKPLATAA